MYFSTAVKKDHLLQILEDHIVKEGNIEQLKEVVDLAQKCLKVREARIDLLGRKWQWNWRGWLS